MLLENQCSIKKTTEKEPSNLLFFPSSSETNLHASPNWRCLRVCALSFLARGSNKNLSLFASSRRVCWQSGKEKELLGCQSSWARSQTSSRGHTAGPPYLSRPEASYEPDANPQVCIVKLDTVALPTFYGLSKFSHITGFFVNKSSVSMGPTIVHRKRYDSMRSSPRLLLYAIVRKRPKGDRDSAHTLSCCNSGRKKSYNSGKG